MKLHYENSKRVTSYLLNALIFALWGCSQSAELTKYKAAANLAYLTIPEATLYDFGTQYLDAQVDKTFTVVNSGKSQASNISGSFTLSSFTFKGGSYPGVGGTCQSTLDAGASCTIVVTFAPPYSGPFSDYVRLSYVDGSQLTYTQSPIVQGKAIAGKPGDYDVAFGGTGLIALGFQLPNVGGHAQAQATGVVTTSNGSYVVGRVWNGSNFDIGMTRLTTWGAIDKTFASGNGVKAIDLNGTDDSPTSLLQQTDGKLIVCGSTIVNGVSAVMAVRLTGNGDLDSSFGNAGVATWTSGSSPVIGRASYLQGDGKTLVVGYRAQASSSDMIVVRFLTNGNLDPTFGSGGAASITFGTSYDQANAVTLQGDGKILVSGFTTTSSDEDMAVVRLRTDGSYDSSFGVGGKNTVDWGNGSPGSMDRSNAIALQIDGKVLIAGYAGITNQSFAVARLNADGSVDPTFGNGGKSALILGDQGSRINALALQSDQKIIAAGSSSSGGLTSQAVMRLTSFGFPDTTYGASGKVLASFGNPYASITALSIQPNGKSYFVGDTAAGSASDFSLLRLWP